MKRKQIVVLFLFLLLGLAIYLIAKGENKDKIGTIIENQKGKAIEAIKKNGSIVLDKAGEKAGETYEAIKQKSGEIVQATIITPVKELAKDLVKKAIVQASSSLTPEEIKDILPEEKGENACKCLDN